MSANDWIAHVAFRLANGEEVVVEEPICVGDANGDAAGLRLALERAELFSTVMSESGVISGVRVDDELGIVAMLRLDYDWKEES